MKNKFSLLYIAIIAIIVPVFANAAPVQVQQKPVVQTAVTNNVEIQSVQTTPLGLVENPTKYLNRKVTFNGKFDKFSTLGLDYKKAFKDSQKYIGFMLQRDDVKDHNVPLSELKLFITREYAEKFIDLNTGDKIKITGDVFSNALGDAWVDVSKIEIIEKTAAKEK